MDTKSDEAVPCPIWQFRIARRVHLYCKALLRQPALPVRQRMLAISGVSAMGRFQARIRNLRGP